MRRGAWFLPTRGVESERRRRPSRIYFDSCCVLSATYSSKYPHSSQTNGMTTRPALVLIAPEVASPFTLISAFRVSVRFMRAFGWLMQYRFPSLIGIRAPSFEGWLGEGQ